MKMLLLLRHGKSPQDGSNDWDRPLSKRAREKDVPSIGEFVRGKGILPEWILSSDARRARDTAELFAQQFDPVPEMVLSRGLYLVSSFEIAAEVKALPDSVSTAVVVGHNSGLEMFAEDLLSAELPSPLSPGGLCIFRLDTDSWLGLHASIATPLAMVNPKDLRDEPIA
jgi:phosphohistidine phosphatase